MVKYFSEATFTHIATFYHKLLLIYLWFVFRHKKTIRVNEGGFYIVVNPKNGFTDKMLFSNKKRDKDITDIMDLHLKEGDHFVDIGMNIGYETLWGATLVGRTGKVTSFEPLPQLINQVQESISINELKNIQIIPKAVGRIAREQTIHLHTRDAGLSSVVNTNGATKTQTILVSTLDAELKDIDSLDLIKMDIEGYEYEALLGGKRILEKFHPPIIFEYTPRLYEKLEKGNSEKLIDYLCTDLEYKLYSLTPSLRLLSKEDIKNITSECLQKNSAVNLLAK